ncbi:MAG: hypothetical protein SGBAC_009891 [Bacillariaceae sp.]
MLFGSDKDAKEKAKASNGGQRAVKPGIERVEDSKASKPAVNETHRSKSKPSSQSSHQSSRNKPSFASGLGAPALLKSDEDDLVMKSLAIPNDPMAATGPEEKSQKRMSKQEKKEEESKKRKKWISICLCLLLVLIGIVVGVIFGMRAGDDDGDITTAVEEDATVLSAHPSGAPSTSPTNAPSTFPTNAPSTTQLYDPPSPDDCIAIAQNRTTSADRAELDQFSFRLTIDVTFETQDDMSDAHLVTLAKAIQTKLVPPVVGCPDASRRNLVEEGPSTIRGVVQPTRRHLAVGDSLGKNRFVIADAFVDGKEVEEACTVSPSPSQCQRVFMDLAVFLKGPIRLLDIIVLISEAEKELKVEKQDDNNLKVPLELGDPFVDVQLATVDSLTVTTTPSITPTGLSSSLPSDMPSPTPSPSTPTGPTTAPPTVSLVPSEDPSESPTFDPASGPTSPSPTSIPSTTPTLTPSTLSPTLAPIVGPSPPPSSTPTSMPSVAPSLSPTVTASNVPSSNPSGAPSSSPTVKASMAPSSNPSPAPTTAPTTAPSPSPSSMPSPIVLLQTRCVFEMDEEAIISHRKKLAQILSYIASWHQALHSGEGIQHSFVRAEEADHDFYQNDELEDGTGVLFSTQNFRTLLTWDAEAEEETLFSSPPFSFYAANAGPTVAATGDRKRSLAGRLKSVSPRTPSSESICWLRLTRLTKAQRLEEPLPHHSAVQTFLDQWMLRPKIRATSYQELLSSAGRINRELDKHPSRPIRVFLKRYKRYLLTNRYQQALEPMYNRLFEWIQQQDTHNQELVWSLGHAKFADPTTSTYIDGPLLDVLVEVDLAPDGALLVKPRQHTGVTLNRQVVAALASSQDVLSKLHRRISQLEASNISPGQPSTYVKILKQLTVELCPDGIFQASAKAPAISPSSVSSSRRQSFGENSLVVSEAWCLYSRLKPTTVWARDANLLADQLTKNQQELSLAAWSLTHGPNVLEEVNAKGLEPRSSKSPIAQAMSFWNYFSNPDQIKSCRPMFPLATSDSQNRIAELLLDQHYPAVVTEGPPGTGKTHSIANIVCAYLCQGKRVLVTSKNSPALSVLRERLPSTVQELCVDVSKSESSGLRQLRQTVERLANRISAASVDIESQKSELLKTNIDELEAKLGSIDSSIRSQSDRVRNVLQGADGIKLAELAGKLMEDAPWLLVSLEEISIKELQSLFNQLKELEVREDAILGVHDFQHPPDSRLVSMTLAKSNSSVSSMLSQASRNWVSSLPVLGSMSGMGAQQNKLQEEMGKITLNGAVPSSNEDWIIVSKALKRSQLISQFKDGTWDYRVRKHGWPFFDFHNTKNVSNCFKVIRLALEVKQLEASLSLASELQKATQCRSLDFQRGRLQLQIRRQAEELVDTAVVAELSKSFTPDAESALIRFAQIAGANKFGKSAKQSKMTQRQRRRRQEYLDAFDKCCRFIPCWILTTSQISDYLPAECLFDLVIIDEASQSDITVLPGMLRGKQWLIVGDGKQVSPTEAFVSEESMETLRAALPESPFERSLMPGQSFFDLCAQAFPRGRVVLSEHFRCSPEIIDFSNKQFYDSRLVPLRLPSQNERLSPSIMDVRVNGKKAGKINEVEADKIIELIQETINLPGSEFQPRSIGVISLIGDEQSRLIRGRLLDAIGPEKMSRHNVLIGDPPTFQGAERDVVFLSMVCSPGSAPTQSQLMHFQRANVALSRARDRCVLVRSIDIGHVSSLEDAKVPIIEFFLQQSHDSEDEDSTDPSFQREKGKGAAILKKLLQDNGYTIADMGIVWKNGVCVEGQKNRAALIVDGEELCSQDWQASYNQQKAIERVGWKCFRVDSLSLFVNMNSTLAKIVDFLDSVGVEKTAAVSTYGVAPDKASNAVEVKEVDEETEGLDAENDSQNDVAAVINQDENHDIVTISSEDDNYGLEDDDRKPAAVPDSAVSKNFDEDNDNIHAGQFGQVVQMDFLRQAPTNDDEDEEMQFGHDLIWDDSKNLDSPTKLKREVTFARKPADDPDVGSMDNPSDDGDFVKEVTKTKHLKPGVAPKPENDCDDESLENLSDDDDFVEEGTKAKYRKPCSKRISPRTRQGKYVARKPSSDDDDEIRVDSASDDEDKDQETKTKYRRLNRKHTSPRTREGKSVAKSLPITIDDKSDDEETPTPSASPKQGRPKRTKKYRKLDSYSRDGRLNKGRFYPSNDVNLDYETDSDLAAASNPVKSEDAIELDEESDSELPESSPFASRPTRRIQSDGSMVDDSEDADIKPESPSSKSIGAFKKRERSK